MVPGGLVPALHRGTGGRGMRIDKDVHSLRGGLGPAQTGVVGGPPVLP